MIDDMASLKQAMEQMDSYDDAVAQAAKDSAARVLSDGKLSFSKLAELIEQRRLLLSPKIGGRLKAMTFAAAICRNAVLSSASAEKTESDLLVLSSKGFSPTTARALFGRARPSIRL